MSQVDHEYEKEKDNVERVHLCWQMPNRIEYFLPVQNINFYQPRASK